MSEQSKAEQNNFRGNDAKTSDQKLNNIGVEGFQIEYVETNTARTYTDLIYSTQPDQEPTPMDEAALIEARRKRREAIKNKYKGHEPSLLVQALRVGSDAQSGSYNATPERSGKFSNHDTYLELKLVVSPSATTAPNSTPGTPKSTHSDIGSPDTRPGREDDHIDDQVDSPTVGNEPSAADYDPTVDMEEERSRHDKRLFKEDETSTERADQEVLESSNIPAEPKAEFDMFAEDDDMFTESSADKTQSTQKPAQALNAIMLDNWDDPEGYYVTILGELIDGRYKVTQNLGRGMFASVIRAIDTTTGESVAIKIVRNNESMRKAGMKEIDILQNITMNDPEDKMQVVRLYRSFDHKSHLCMVFENLSMNLREVLKKYGRDVGISLKSIRAYAQQLFRGLSLLRKCQLIHADLKPDNILVNEARSAVKICDLGSASPITENATAPYLVSRFYRAPEVILGIPYDYGIDMWSIGCTLFELHTGKILFTGRNNNNMLRTIMECRGKFPNKLLRRGSLTYDYFDDLLNFKAMEPDKMTGNLVMKILDVKAKPVRDLRSRLVPKGKRVDEQERKELDLFVDLLDKCLALSVEKRLTATEALKHPFITRAK